MTELIEQILSERPYHKGDLERLVEIEKSSGEASWNRDQIVFNSRKLDSDTQVIVAGDDDSHAIGFYAVQHDEHTLYICNLAVCPAWRRQGVGLFALESIEKMAKSLNYRNIELHVQEYNLAAQLLYKRGGYEVVEIRKEHYQTQDGYRMTKDLTLAKS